MRNKVKIMYLHDNDLSMYDAKRSGSFYIVKKLNIKIPVEHVKERLWVKKSLLGTSVEPIVLWNGKYDVKEEDYIIKLSAQELTDLVSLGEIEQLNKLSAMDSLPVKTLLLLLVGGIGIFVALKIFGVF